jgi:hypothetical protein
VASVAVEFDTNFISSPITLTIVSVNTNQFSFFISNGIPKTVCSIYDSADLTHWTLDDSLVLDANGTSESATDCDRPSQSSGLVSGNFVNYTAVPYRFYKVTDGQFVSRTIGFCQIWVGPGTATNSPGLNALVANQFDEPNGNTLDGIFKPANQISGELPLPAGTVVTKWDTVAQAYDYYTWSGTSWGGNGGITLNPGEAAYIVNLTNYPVLVTFAGLVREGELSLAISTNQLASSILPKAGLIQSTLGYSPNNGDKVFIWTGSGYVQHNYIASSDKWTGVNGEPVLNVGEGFFIEPAATNLWIEYYSSHQF